MMRSLAPVLALALVACNGSDPEPVPVVAGALPEEARQVVTHRCQSLGCELWMAGPRLRREQRRDGTWSFATPMGGVQGVRLGLRGVHQGSNALTALAILHRLRSLGFLLPDDAIVRGLSGAFLPGRLEQLRPGLVADGAHNPLGGRALAAWLSQRPKPGWRILLLGMGRDRDPVPFVEPLVPYVDEIVTVQAAHPKARDPTELAMELQDFDVELAAGGTVDETLPEVFVEALETIVTGSLFVAGAARAVVTEGVLDGLQAGQGPLDGDAERPEEEA